MPRIAKLVPWLQKLFPSAGGRAPSATEISDFISLVHPLLNGTDRLKEHINFNTTSAAGVAFLNSGAAPFEKYWYVFYASGEHNDPVARSLQLSANFLGVEYGIAQSRGAIPAGERVVSPRPLLLIPRIGLRVEADAIAAAQVVTLTFSYIELDLGEPHPGL